MAFVIVATVAENPQGNHTFNILVPDGIGAGNGGRQQPLGHKEKKQGAEQAAGEDRFDNGTERNAAGLECGQLVAVIEQTQGNDPGEQDEHRTKLINDKGNIEDEKFEYQTQRLASLHKIVYLLKKIDKDVDGGKTGGNSGKDSDELGQYVAV